MTRGDIKTRALSRLGISGPVTAVIDSLFHDGYQDVLLRTHCLIRSQDVLVSSLTAGNSAGDYVLPSNMLAVTSLSTSEGDAFPANASDIRHARSASAVAGTVSFFSVEGSDLLMLFPDPAATATLTFYYVPRPEPLTDDEYEPELVPSEHHRLIEEYLLWRLADTDDDTSSEQGERYREHYLSSVHDARRSIRKMGGRRNPPARPGRRRVSVGRGVDVG